MDKQWTQLKNGDLVQRAEEFLTEYILSGEVAPGDYLPRRRCASGSASVVARSAKR
ncbi:MAG: hypothetical protein GXP25_13530 [Planctomycetes bacterium]|nr:hypothetical protein [Planctomycetota bacterium]